MELFNLIDVASFSKVKVSEDDLAKYVPYIANRHFSYFKDTFAAAHTMNRSSMVPKEVQFTYYLNRLKPRKRFYKWPKKQNNEDVKLLSQFYKINEQEATVYLSLLSEEQLNKIKRYMSKGGMK